MRLAVTDLRCPQMHANLSKQVGFACGACSSTIKKSRVRPYFARPVILLQAEAFSSLIGYYVALSLAVSTPLGIFRKPVPCARLEPAFLSARP